MECDEILSFCLLLMPLNSITKAVKEKKYIEGQETGAKEQIIQTLVKMVGENFQDFFQRNQSQLQIQQRQLEVYGQGTE